MTASTEHAEQQAAASSGWRSVERALRQSVQTRFDRWLVRQVPPSRRVRLTRRNVFIFPTRQGLMFGVVVVLLLIAAINYQNSLIYLLAFLLVGMFLLCILQTFHNLAGMTIEVARTESGHAGEGVHIELRLTPDGQRCHYGVFLGWRDEPQVVSDVETSDARLRLRVSAPRRGRIRPGRLLLASFFPLGLLRAWSWIDLDCEVIVYPAALPGPLPLTATVSTGARGYQIDRAAAEFHGLRDYRAGDPVRGIAWRRYATNGEVLTKEFASGVGAAELWFDWALFGGMGTEERLQRLTGWVLIAARDNLTYGLRIPGVVLEPGTGEPHRLLALRSLALFGEPVRVPVGEPVGVPVGEPPT